MTDAQATGLGILILGLALMVIAGGLGLMAIWTWNWIAALYRRWAVRRFMRQQVSDRRAGNRSESPRNDAAGRGTAIRTLLEYPKAEARGGVSRR